MGRAAVLSIAGLFGGRETGDAPMEQEQMAPLGGTFLQLAFETAGPAMPETPGTNVAWSIVPELVGGVVMDERRGEVFGGSGLRIDLALANRDDGGRTTRAGFFFAARALVIGDRQRDTVGGWAIGEYVEIRRSLRLTGELGVLMRGEEPTIEHTVYATVGLGWRL